MEDGGGRILVASHLPGVRDRDAVDALLRAHGVCGDAANRRALVELDIHWKLQPGRGYPGASVEQRPAAATPVHIPRR